MSKVQGNILHVFSKIETESRLSFLLLSGELFVGQVTLQDIRSSVKMYWCRVNLLNRYRIKSQMCECFVDVKSLISRQF